MKRRPFGSLIQRPPRPGYYVTFMWRAAIPDPEAKAYVHYLSLAVSGGIVGYVVSATFLSALYSPHLYVLTAFAILGRKFAIQYSRKAAS